MFGLLGPNGAGKSTTVRVLTTLTRADAGRALVAGEDVAQHPNRVRRKIGYVAQDSGVDWEATGRENLLLQGRIHGMGGRELRGRVDQLLELVGLREAADRVSRTYSGGMKRRLDVATGLVHRPSVLFLDEPTTGLDPEARAAMWVEVERLAEQEALTILLTTHYLEEADRLAERVAIVSHGRVVAEGTPDDLKRGLEGESITVELQEVNGRLADAERVIAQIAGNAVVGRAAGACTRPERRAGDPDDPQCARRRRRRGRLRHDGAAVARRRVPPLHGARVFGNTRKELPDAAAAPHVVDGRAPGPQPRARADLDRDDGHPADALAAPLRPAVQARRCAGPVERELHRVPDAGDRRHERVLRWDVVGHGDDQRPRQACDRPVPRGADGTHRDRSLQVIRAGLRPSCRRWSSCSSGSHSVYASTAVCSAG